MSYGFCTLFIQLLEFRGRKAGTFLEVAEMLDFWSSAFERGRGGWATVETCCFMVILDGFLSLQERSGVGNLVRNIGKKNTKPIVYRSPVRFIIIWGYLKEWLFRAPPGIDQSLEGLIKAWEGSGKILVRARFSPKVAGKVSEGSIQDYIYPVKWVCLQHTAQLLRISLESFFYVVAG